MKTMTQGIRQSNPFYLLSAMCMLGGCLTLSHSVVWTYTPNSRDLRLLIMLSVYEAALIGLAWFLIRRRGLFHDGAMLVAMEAFFLVDVTFLSAQVITTHFWPAAVVNAAVFAAAMVKLWLLAGMLGISPRDGRFMGMAMQVAALFVMPFAFQYFDHGDVSPLYFYGAWWLAGLFIPAGLTLAQKMRRNEVEPWAQGLVRLLCVLPWLSYLMHLGILHYVYNVEFFGAEAAPVLLGLACLMHHVEPSGFAGRRDLRFLKLILPASAVFVSLNDPWLLTMTLSKHGRMNLTPTELAMAGAYLTYIYCFARPHAIRLIAAGTAAVLGWALGPSAQQVGGWSERSWNWVSGVAWDLVPKTAAKAGATAIAAAFGFLGLGAMVSLRRRPPEVVSETPELKESEEGLV